MEDDTQKRAKKGRSRILLVLTSVYALLYILIIVTENYGAAVVMGLPLFVLAVLFIIAWFKKRNAARTAPSTQKSNTSRGGNSC